jgi:hypothetical protein
MPNKKPKAQVNYCAPDSEAQESFRKSKTCFTLSSLQKLARAWNDRYAGARAAPIMGIATLSKSALWRALNTRMQSQCSGMGAAGREGCWVDTLQMGEHSEPFQDMRYPKPADWYRQPRKWLNNFNIEDVMEQYERDPANRYRFLGVYPMDFADVYTELNDVRWSYLTNGGTCDYVGLITNLDDHDEPGSHWTSFFAVLDPKKPSFGAYYYDSVSSPPTVEIKEFMIKLMVKAFVQALRGTAVPTETLMDFPFEKYNGTEVKAFTAHLMATVRKTLPLAEVKKILPYPFKLEYNTHQHQYKNTECGMFSMVYQIRWLEGLRRDPMTTFDKVVQHRMNDDDVFRFRDILFRPNSAVAPAKPI